jgi:hypothetical protein
MTPSGTEPATFRLSSNTKLTRNWFSGFRGKIRGQNSTWRHITYKIHTDFVGEKYKIVIVLCIVAKRNTCQVFGGEI